MKTRQQPRLIVAIALAALSLAAAAPAPAAPLENDPEGFLRDRSPFEQEAREIATGGFARKLICAEDCLASGRVMVSARQAQELGLAERGQGDVVEIGRFSNVQLEARTWKVVHVTLRADAERALRTWDGSVRIHGESIAVSVQSQRFGQAGWARTCGRAGELRPLARKRR
jgi:hypothetical protein